MLASLDHAIWFHRPFRADDWLLYAQDSPTSGGGRAFCRGTLFTREGVLVASTAQEGLVRERDGRKSCLNHRQMAKFAYLIGRQVPLSVGLGPPCLKKIH